MMERTNLIRICEQAIVDQKDWQNRDTASSIINVGKCWALLKAGCKYEIKTKENEIGSCITDDDTIWIQFWVKDFKWFDVLDADEEDFPDGLEGYEYHFYLPTEKRLKDANGKDWY